MLLHQLVDLVGVGAQLRGDVLASFAASAFVRCCARGSMWPR